MPRKQHKYHYIYKTTCLVNNKFYIGMHSTSNLNDGYIGSGKRLRYSLNKYGKENFKFEILEYLESREALKNREKELINEELLKDSLCLNLKIGGEGGWEYVNILSRPIGYYSNWSNAGGKAYVKRFNEDLIFKQQVLNRLKEAQEKRIKTQKERYPNGTFFNKTHTDEYKIKMSLKAKLRLKDPTKNSQYGTMWITNGIENKKIKKDSNIPDGWSKGRNI